MTRRASIRVTIFAMRITLTFVSIAAAALAADKVWSVYGGDAGGTRYSPLKQITRENVARLKPRSPD